MAYFEDLSRYAYFDPAAGDIGLVRNVGWLDASHDFERELPSTALLDAVWEYSSIIVASTRGLHDCEFCVDPDHSFVRGATRRLLGSGEIRVSGANGDAFAAPNLLYHYIVEHQYRPPREFLDAVRSGSRPRSETYLRQPRRTLA